MTDRSFFNLSLRIRFLFVSVNFVQVAKLNKFCIIFILLIIWFFSGCEGFRFCEFRWFGRWIDWIKPEKKNNEELWTDSEFGFSRFAFFFSFLFCCYLITFLIDCIAIQRFKKKKMNLLIANVHALRIKLKQNEFVVISDACPHWMWEKKRIKNLIGGGGFKFCYISEFLFCCNWVCVSYMWSCLYYRRK